MKKNKLLVQLLVCIFVLGVFFVSCGSDESDTWSPVASILQLSGTWSGSLNERMSIRNFIEMSGETYTPEMAALFGNMNVNISATMITTVNASARTSRQLTNETYRFTGGNINTAWPFIRAIFQGSDFTINDANRSISIVYDYTETITDSDLLGMRINKNGRRVKAPFYLGDRRVDVIFTRQ